MPGGMGDVPRTRSVELFTNPRLAERGRAVGAAGGGRLGLLRGASARSRSPLGRSARRLTENMSREKAEAALRKLIEKGDHRAALEGLMKQYGETVYRFCLRIVKDVSKAEDLHQNIFLKAYLGLPTFAGDSSLLTWLLGIAKNRSIDELRSSNREASRVLSDDELLGDAIAAGPGPGELFDKGADWEALEACLNECVSAEEKFLILLHFAEGLSYEEMGTSLGKKADSLRARAVRAFPGLRRCLEKKGAKP
jgi:RNA polymerase sigma-70 factor, ECF subfamily